MTQKPFASGPSGIRTVRELLSSLDRADRLTQLAEICRISEVVHQAYARHGPFTGNNPHEIADALDQALQLDPPTTVEAQAVDEPLGQIRDSLRLDEEGEES